MFPRDKEVLLLAEGLWSKPAECTTFVYGPLWAVLLWEVYLGTVIYKGLHYRVDVQTSAPSCEAVSIPDCSVSIRRIYEGALVCLFEAECALLLIDIEKRSSMLDL